MKKTLVDSRFKNIGKFAEPRNIQFQTVLVPPQAGGVSGTEMRGFIKMNDKALKKMSSDTPEKDKQDAWSIVTKSQENPLNENLNEGIRDFIKTNKDKLQNLLKNFKEAWNDQKGSFKGYKGLVQKFLNDRNSLDIEEKAKLKQNTKDLFKTAGIIITFPVLGVTGNVLLAFLVDKISKGQFSNLPSQMANVVGEDLYESGADTAWEDEEGNKVTLQDILDMTKNITIKNFPTEKLAKIVLNWDNNPEEIERISQVTVSQQYPILIMVDESGKIQWILDGNHRAQKALRSKAKTISAKLIKKGIPYEVEGLDEDLYNPEDKVLDYMRGSEWKAGMPDGPKKDINPSYKYKRGGLYGKMYNETVTDTDIICDNCGWTWAIVDGGDDLYNCHKLYIIIT